MDLVDEILKGNKRAVARLITMAENGDDIVENMSKIHKHGGKSHIVGITGPPGVGKSTLIHKLTKFWREKSLRVGIIAVDPTSPFSGGALLGDRIRMQDLALDKDVFIRSMGTRGHLGGISMATTDAIKILDAYGCDKIIVETVGAGQSEVEIMHTAHTVVVVLVPSMGDEIQTIKAGILEIGDIFVVNKSDMEGSDRTVRDLKDALSKVKNGWKIPIIKTIGRENMGISNLAKIIDEHYYHLRSSGRLRMKNMQRCKNEIEEMLIREVIADVFRKIGYEKLDILLERVTNREISPRDAVKIIKSEFFSK